MFPIKYIRENIEKFKKAAEAKGEKVNWEEFEKLDNERRKYLTFIEERRKIQNDLTEKIASLKNNRDAIQPLLLQAKKYSDEIREYEKRLAEIEEKFKKIVESIPNIPHPSVPEGKDASSNVIVREWGKIEEKDFEILPHWEIGEKLGILDFSLGSKITGSFFPVFIGKGAFLVRALINFMIDLHKKNGFEEIP